MQKLDERYSTEEVAACLCRLATQSAEGTIFEETEECLYWLLNAAKNKYNQEYFRTLWNLIQDIAHIHQGLIYDY